MTFLGKTNPNATPSSVRRWAVIGSLIGLGCYSYWASQSDWPRLYWYIAAPVVMLLGAIAGALIEWQVDD